MEKIKVLDCTLRDGGYCNQWQFGFANIKKITESLVHSGIDIIECGFLTQKISYDSHTSKFTTIQDITNVIPSEREGKIFVVMMNYGEYDIECLPEHNNDYVDGIRLAFHKKNMKEALEFGRLIQEKGYLLFIQPMISLDYSDEEFLNLIQECAKMKPYAFYIVDSFGVMKKKDLIRLFFMVEHRIGKESAIGFHSHNNMQLAYANAQILTDIKTCHTLIIDCSIYGMGRGAGNLNTELFVSYLNDSFNTEYRLGPLLSIIDEVLDGFYKKSPWGYSLPNYLSAVHNVHPNYAGYLNDKNTLTVEKMNEIFSMMEDDKRVHYDKEYIEKLYTQYLSSGQVQENRRVELVSKVKGKKLLLIAPGKSSHEDKEKIKDFAKDNGVVTVSVNFDYPYVDTDYIFLSNLRRFRELDKCRKDKCIVTSNIPSGRVYLRTGYKELLNSYEMVSDNAGMMAIKFFAECMVKEVYLAGFDGYSHDVMSNYGDSHMVWIMKNAVLDAMNEGMMQVLMDLSQSIQIRFLTQPRYINIYDVSK